MVLQRFTYWLLLLEGALAHNPLSITHVLAQDYELQGMRIFGAVTSQSFTEKIAYVEPLPKNAIALTWANHHRQKTGD